MLEYMKQALKNEAKKLKEMNGSEKKEYIWEYYKIPIIGTIIILLISASIINSVFINPPKKTFAAVSFFGSYIPDEKLTSLESLLTENLVEDKDKYMVYSYSFTVGNEDPQIDMAMTQKFMAMISAKELDILITDKGNFDALVKEAYFLNLNDFNTESFSNELVYGVTNESTVEMPYGIKLSDNSFFKELGFNTDNLYMGVIINTEKLDNTKAVLEYIMKK